MDTTHERIKAAKAAGMLTPVQVAKAIGKSTDWVRKQIPLGRCSAVCIGGRWFLTKDAADELRPFAGTVAAAEVPS